MKNPKHLIQQKYVFYLFIFYHIFYFQFLSNRHKYHLHMRAAYIFHLKFMTEHIQERTKMLFFILLLFTTSSLVRANIERSKV